MEPKEALLPLGHRRRPSRAVCPASCAVRSLCHQRSRSALLTQTESRIGHKCGVRERLGEATWAAFVRYAEREHKADSLGAFAPASGELWCEGRLDGAPCPHEVGILKLACSPMQGTVDRSEAKGTGFK